jgi:cytochrome c oxidase accessory protein FixG
VSRNTLIDRRQAPGAGDTSGAGGGASTEPPGEQRLYAKRKQIYPKLAHGRFRTLKWIAMIVLLAIYYLTPWIRWERPGVAADQAVLVDFAGRRFYFFWIELWPQETYFIAGLLILAALGIFLSSAVLGRVWCGYACPQTVWTDLYLHVERLIEGDRAARMRLAKAPLSLQKATKKVAKHTIWLAIALVTGGAWIFYFTDAPTLARQLLIGEAHFTAYLYIGLLTFTTYTLAGTMREQVCTYMCPWPRIQAAMTDRDALSVVYRGWRGEPRGPHKKDATWEGRGDCVDCRQCVDVCPQGIDIRDGDQLECINCALCIDACDAIMDKVGRPRGLIAYDSFRNLERRTAGDMSQWSLLRPRTVLYGVLLVAVGAAMLYGLLTRDLLALDAMRDRSPPYVRLHDGGVRNGYDIRIINKIPETRELRLRVSGLEGAQLSALGATTAPDGSVALKARPDAVTTTRLYVIAHDAPPGSTKITLTLEDPARGDAAVRNTVFLTGAAP